MTLLKIVASCKFRAFGMDFGKVGPIEFQFPVDAASGLLARHMADKFHLNQRGLKIDATIETADVTEMSATVIATANDGVSNPLYTKKTSAS